MKKLVLLFAALLVAGCGEKSSPESSDSASEESNSLSDADVEQLVKEAVDRDSIEERDGLYYQTNESEPFSGWAKSMYDSGQVQALAQFKDGKQDGLFTVWDENGQKMAETIHKDGELDGLWTSWHENGQKRGEGTYKDGKRNGPATSWHENGQKDREGTYKDGKPDGLGTMWHENGQKMNESTYKDGELISEKWWNAKGEEVETEEEAFK